MPTLLIVQLDPHCWQPSQIHQTDLAEKAPETYSQVTREKQQLTSIMWSPEKQPWFLSIYLMLLNPVRNVDYLLCSTAYSAGLIFSGPEQCFVVFISDRQSSCLRYSPVRARLWPGVEAQIKEYDLEAVS